MNQPAFTCPICHLPLIAGEKTWQCVGHAQEVSDIPQETVPEQAVSQKAVHQDPCNTAMPAKRHSFDVAKQGYVNLLPVQHKKSKNPGDTQAAISARQRFLGAGYYQVLRQGLVEFCQRILTEPPTTWLDIGCGEGYYSEALLGLNPAYFVALDISKPAGIATAKRLKALSATSAHPFTIVASAAQVPMAEQSVDVISTIFSPILPEEFARLIREHGHVVIAKPAVNHLFEMREALFDTVVDHDSQKFIDTLAPQFTLIDQQRITSQISVTPAALDDLLTMTPYTYRAKPENRQALLAQGTQAGELTLTLDFVLYGFVKN